MRLKLLLFTIFTLLFLISSQGASAQTNSQCLACSGVTTAGSACVYWQGTSAASGSCQAQAGNAQCPFYCVPNVATVAPTAAAPGGAGAAASGPNAPPAAGNRANRAATQALGSGVGSFSQTFGTINQSLLGGAQFGQSSNLVGLFISNLLPYLMIIAGIILFIMILSGGFKIMTAVQDPNQSAAGKQQIAMAVVGFLLLVSSYWIAQMLQIMFGIQIL